MILIEGDFIYVFGGFNKKGYLYDIEKISISRK